MIASIYSPTAVATSGSFTIKIVAVSANTTLTSTDPWPSTPGMWERRSGYYEDPRSDFDYELERLRRELEEAKRRRPPMPPPPPIDGYQPRPALPIRPVPRIMRVQSRGG